MRVPACRPPSRRAITDAAEDSQAVRVTPSSWTSATDWTEQVLLVEIAGRVRRLWIIMIFLIFFPLSQDRIASPAYSPPQCYLRKTEEGGFYLRLVRGKEVWRMIPQHRQFTSDAPL